MNLPNRLLDAINDELYGHSFSKLSETAKAVSDNYRSMTGVVKGKDEVKAYVAYRMPGTFSALHHVFDKISKRMPDFKPESLLDVGAGPGTSLWASSLVFDTLRKFSLYEHEYDMILAGKRMLEYLNEEEEYDIHWNRADITKDTTLEKMDIVVASYVLNEIDKDKRQELVKKLWECTNHVLVLIEPGSKAGFSIIDECRNLLINSGGYVIAPCTHNNSCPMEKDDWCHFSARVNRSDFLRYAKGGTLPYEDEKFSYVCLSKREYICEAEGVVVFPPKPRKGHIILDLCTKDGIVKKTFSKKDGEVYKKARDLSLGDDK